MSIYPFILPMLILTTSCNPHSDYIDLAHLASFDPSTYFKEEDLGNNIKLEEVNSIENAFDRMSQSPIDKDTLGLYESRSPSLWSDSEYDISLDIESTRINGTSTEFKPITSYSERRLLKVYGYSFSTYTFNYDDRSAVLNGVAFPYFNINVDTENKVMFMLVTQYKGTKEDAEKIYDYLQRNKERIPIEKSNHYWMDDRFYYELGTFEEGEYQNIQLRIADKDFARWKYDNEIFGNGSFMYEYFRSAE